MKNFNYKYLFRNPGMTLYDEKVAPKDINDKDKDVFYHVRYGSSKLAKTRFVSTTAELDQAIKWKVDEKTDYKNEVLLIFDVKKVLEHIDEGKIIDFTERSNVLKKFNECEDEEKNSQEWVEFAANYAASSKEVLFDGVEIPRSCYHVIPWRVMEYELSLLRNNDGFSHIPAVEGSIAFMNKHGDNWEKVLDEEEEIQSKMSNFYIGLGLISMTDVGLKDNLELAFYSQNKLEQLKPFIKEGVCFEEVVSYVEDIARQKNVSSDYPKEKIEKYLKYHFSNLEEFRRLNPEERAKTDLFKFSDRQNIEIYKPEKGTVVFNSMNLEDETIDEINKYAIKSPCGIEYTMDEKRLCEEFVINDNDLELLNQGEKIATSHKDTETIFKARLIETSEEARELKTARGNIALCKVQFQDNFVIEDKETQVVDKYIFKSEYVSIYGDLPEKTNILEMNNNINTMQRQKA